MRHTISAFVASVAIAFAASPALAQNSAAPNGTPGALNRYDPHAIRCQKFDAATGSHIGSRVVCLTNAQWEEVHRQARDGWEMEIKKSVSPTHT
ncbi:MAG TPA: hypothetical protein VG867_03920 [Rhizomicrobium sp.]|nr:hypothetical protein [Rhizomicrobium sp.]